MCLYQRIYRKWQELQRLFYLSYKVIQLFLIELTNLRNVKRAEIFIRINIFCSQKYICMKYCLYKNVNFLSMFMFILKISELFLADIDECCLLVNNCHKNSTCLNTIGSFVCSCDVGFVGSGELCKGLKCFKFCFRFNLKLKVS